MRTYIYNSLPTLEPRALTGKNLENAKNIQKLFNTS